MNLKNDFIICSNETLGAIYYIPTCKLLSVTPKLAQKFKYEIHTNNISESTKNFFQKNFSPTIYDHNNSIDFLKNRRLHKVQFLVTNRCTLNCKYCYANGGTYGQEYYDMTPDTAEQIIDYLSNYVDQIDSVQFFGGEPLLAYKTIMKICDKISSTFKNTPNFSTVSNFTILPLEFIDYIKKYNISITVSLDGPPEINNILRVHKSNTSFNTFDTVKNNINLLRSYNSDIKAIECTYTDTHQKLGYTKHDLINFFKNEFNITNIIIENEEKSDNFMSSTSFKKDLSLSNDSNTSLNKKIGLIKSILDSKYKKFHCGVGFSALSFTFNGDIYPCHRFFSNQKYSMGNIFDSNLIYSSKFKNIRKILTNINKENQKCSECNARNFCCQCPAYILLRNENTFNENICTSYKNISDDLILDFLNFYKSNKYFYFLSQIKNSLKGESNI